jgi:hypothetical protein
MEASRGAAGLEDRSRTPLPRAPGIPRVEIDGGPEAGAC